MQLLLRTIISKFINNEIKTNCKFGENRNEKNDFKYVINVIWNNDCNG